MNRFAPAILFAGLLAQVQAKSSKVLDLDESYDSDFDGVKIASKMQISDAFGGVVIKGDTTITVEEIAGYPVSYPVSYEMIRYLNSYGPSFLSIAVQGDEDTKDQKWPDPKKESNEQFNCNGEWWFVDQKHGNKAAFQVVTLFENHDDYSAMDDKPSYWPYENASIRLQYWVQEKDVYFSTFLDFEDLTDVDWQKDDACRGGCPYWKDYQLAVHNEFWVGSKLVNQTSWFDKFEGGEEIKLHEVKKEEPSTNDGVAMPALVAICATATLALTAYCAHRAKRANVDDRFQRI